MSVWDTPAAAYAVLFLNWLIESGASIIDQAGLDIFGEGLELGALCEARGLAG